MKVKTIIIGVVLLVGSIVGLAFIGRILNPPAQQVYVAAKEIQPGDVLGPEIVELVDVRLPATDMYFTPDDINNYEGAVFVETVHTGMFVPKVALSHEANPASSERVALALSDTDMVAMVIPVTPLTTPRGIVVGDRVSLTVSVGAATFLTGEFSNVPTPKPVTGYGSSAGATEGSMAGIPTPALPFRRGEEAAGPTPSPTAEKRIMLPITKTIVTNGRILDILHEESLAAAFNEDDGNQEPLQGDIRAVVVAVKLNVQEALSYAINNGEVRIAVVSPNADVADNGLTPGMSWDDMVSYYRMELAMWALTPQPLDDLEAPGASMYYSTVMATLFPSATPTITPTPTETVVITATATMDPDVTWTATSTMDPEVTWTPMATGEAPVEEGDIPVEDESVTEGTKPTPTETPNSVVITVVVTSAP